MDSRGLGRIYTVRAGRPFLRALAEALLAGDLPVEGGPRPTPLELADTTLLLPSRGTVAALQTAFLEAGKGAALLLPRIKPVADTATELDVLTTAQDLAASAATGAHRVIGQLERQLVLTELVMHWAARTRAATGGDVSSTGRSTPAQAAHLAKELALLMDLLEGHGLDAARLADLVPEELSEHWQQTLRFLQIATQFWPKHLADAQLVSPVAHRHRLLRAEIARLAAHPASAPVVLAGVTDLDPVALDLARAVLARPNGAIVLPALDQDADEATWRAICPAHPEHPQFGLATLLAGLGLARSDVRELPGPKPSPAQAARARLASETMRPAETTEHWHTYVARARGREMARALDGVTLVEAASAEEEAEAVALMLREAAETPGRKAALVTPDRNLARRVCVRLRAWDLKIPLSTGTPFAQTQSGTFLDLVVETVAQGFEPVTVATLLKHPLLRAGLPEQEVRAGVRALELAAFRQPYFGEGLDGILAALQRAEESRIAGKRQHQAAARLGASDWEAARALLDALARAMRPLVHQFSGEASRPLADLVRAHTNAALELAPAEGLYHGPAGEWVAGFFAKLLDADARAPAMAAADYPEFYRALVAEKSLRIDGPQHPRIWVWDPFEARLQQPDLVILGALNESTWPANAEPGPWLSRPMRAALGLPAPEERIGAAAHDFASLLCAERVVLTRAAKVDGAPTVPSRWLLRLNALRGKPDASAPSSPWLAWAGARNAAHAGVSPVSAPAPTPPLALRPRRLSVTAVEKWFANPYGLYAQRILGLEPLPDLGRQPDAALRGEIIHDALGRFARAYPRSLPADVAGELMRLAEASLRDLTGSPRVAAFWVPRFARFAAWFAETEPARREGTTHQLAEIEGAAVLDARAGPFTLTARADRIDVSEVAGRLTLVITDYKSGGDVAKLAGRAASGLAPQLPLEAAIALAAGFTGLGAQSAPPAVAHLRYISASGGEPAGQEKLVPGDDAAALAGRLRTGLVALIDAFDTPATPYRAVRRPQFTYDYDAYAHLARVAEWSSDVASEEG